MIYQAYSKFCDLYFYRLHGKCGKTRSNSFLVSHCDTKSRKKERSANLAPINSVSVVFLLCSR